MDGTQFDRLLRTVTTTRSRRSAMLSVLGGALGLIGLTEAEAKHHKKKKKKKGGSPPASPPASPPSPPAVQCPASCPVCQACTNGQSCTVQADGATCENNPCKGCQNGACVNLANDTACNGDGRCLNGVCNPNPHCWSTGLPCIQGPDETPCCAGVCQSFGSATTTCGRLNNPGLPCNVGTDCELGSCVGYRCQ
jgi:hypothetical protein